MGRSKKKSEPKRRPKRPKPFNAALRDLKYRTLETAEEAPPPPPPSRPVPAAKTDEELFLEEMTGVAPLSEEERFEPVAKPPHRRQRHPQADDGETEAMARLADLCAGVGPFEIADTSEYIQGSAPGIDRRLVRRLRRGEFSVQAHLDLHGMVRDEARRSVDRFVCGSRARGLRCVLIVHGRGLNSKDHIPVLKEKLRAWLTRGKIGRQVLAFATARPHDGGAGAVYVLLRK